MDILFDQDLVSETSERPLLPVPAWVLMFGLFDK